MSDTSIDSLIAEYVGLTATKERLEQELSNTKQQIDHLLKVDIPSELSALGVEKLTTQSGFAVGVKQEVFCAISKDQAAREVAFEWLRENGAGDKIVDQVIVDNMSEEDMKEIAKRYLVEHKQDINAQTLKAFMRRGLGFTGQPAQFMADEVPSELHLYTTPLATIKRA